MTTEKHLNRTKRLPRLQSTIGLAVACLVFSLITYHYWTVIGDHVVDDAFIFFRYADNLVHGDGLTFNPGERLEGYTSFLWTLLVAFGIASGLPALGFAQIAGVILALVTLYFVWRSARILFDENPLLSAFPPLFLALNRTFVIWSIEAMETKLYGACVAAAFFFWLRGAAPKSRRIGFPLVGMSLGLAALTRPEGYLIAAMFFALQLIACVRTRAFGQFAVELASCVLLIGGHLAFRLGYYGEPLPNTFYAKVNGIQLDAGAQYLWMLVKENGFLFYSPIPILGIFAWLRTGSSSVQKWFVILLPVVTAVYLLLIGGDYFEFRFFDVALPFWAFLGAGGVQFLYRVISRKIRATAAVAAVVLSSCVLFCNGLTVLRPHQGNKVLSSPEREARFTETYAETARWLALNLDPGESIAIRPAGVIPYLTRAYSLDLYGLNDYEIAHSSELVDEQRVIAHQRKVGRDYAEARGITYFIGSPRVGNRRCPAGQCTSVEIAPGEHFRFLPLTTAAKFSKRHYSLDEHAGSLEGWTPVDRQLDSEGRASRP